MKKESYSSVLSFVKFSPKETGEFLVATQGKVKNTPERPCIGKSFSFPLSLDVYLRQNTTGALSPTVVALVEYAICRLETNGMTLKVLKS